jgi:DNA-binding Lrp family transcriptional regulator
MDASYSTACIPKTNGQEIVIEGLQAAWEALNADADGFTSRDVAAQMGVKEPTARKRLKELFDAGKIKRVGRKTYERIDGGNYYLTAFRVV